MTHSDKLMREAFEKWFTGHPHFGQYAGIEKNPDDTYVDCDAADCWEAWQAAIDHQHKHLSPLDGLKMEAHVITGEMTKPSTRWCNTCKSQVCVLDEQPKTSLTDEEIREGFASKVYSTER